MRLPFVGKSKTASSDYNPYGRVFGYIFGCISNSSSNAVSGATYQYHYTPSGSSTVYYHYYIPTTLKRVTIGGGEVNGSAFYNCSMLTEVVLEDGVTGINSSAFENCSKLTNVVLSDNVTSIGDRAFLLCSGLTSIAIGNKVTNIGYNAFWSCSKLADISFNGTKEQWKAISKGNNWDNGVPATKVVCTDGEVLI